MHLTILQYALAHLWITVIVVLGIGVLIGWFLFGRFPPRRVRHIVSTVFEPSTIEELTVGSLFSRIIMKAKVTPERLALASGGTVRRSVRRPEQLPPLFRRIHSGVPLASSITIDDEALWYRHPGDANPDEPTEYGIPLVLPVRQRFPDGRVVRSDLRTVPLTVDHAGTWLTAPIDETSNLSLAHPPSAWQRVKGKTRRPHFSDYYPAGAPIGWVLVRDGRKKTYHRYDAPANVVFAQHSVAPGEPVDAGDIVALLAEVPGVVDVKSDQPPAMFFRSRPGEPPLVSIGQTVSAGQTLALLHYLHNWVEIESPTSGIVLRIDVPNDTPIQYGQRLFQIKAPPTPPSS